LEGSSAAATSSSGGPGTTDDPLLTPEQAAHQLGKGVRYVRRLIQERRVDYVKLSDGRNGPVRIRQSALEAYIERCTVRAVR
jgi:excisionase family DNA binding protein